MESAKENQELKVLLINGIVLFIVNQYSFFKGVIDVGKNISCNIKCIK